MSLESPVASEPDSLGEKEPMEKATNETNFVRGHSNYTTFTRKRPTNLRRNPTRVHRQSLLSPHSVDNLDIENVNTPDFAMTQSMYEPFGKKEQIEKLTQESRLMNLIASEKAAYAAQKRKQKEMKLKAIEQKKKNEERQKIVEERRIRMLAEEEEKRKRIMNKTTKNNNMMASCYGNMTQSIMEKSRTGSNSKFLSNRPMSSTGKVFGFGSSTPRCICDPIKTGKSSYNQNPSLLDMSKVPVLPISRMCTSQIVSRSTQPETRRHSVKNFASNISKSTANISDMKKIRNNNGNVPPTLITGQSHTKIRVLRTTPKSIKTFNSAIKIETVDNVRSRTPTKDVTTPTKPRSTTTERTGHSLNKIETSNNSGTQLKIQKTRSKSHSNRTIVSDNERNTSAGISLKLADNRPPSILTSDNESDQNSKRKSEVRFINTTINSNDNITSQPRKDDSKELSKQEYKERMTLQRKLAKEKRLKVENEKEMGKENLISEKVVESLTPVDISITTESEISINILPKDQEIIEIPKDHPSPPSVSEKFVETKDEVKIGADILQKDKEIVEVTSQHEARDDEASTTSNRTTIPRIEISKGKEEMTASTDELDRIERKKRLESIMSRIKKTPTGSTENISQHMTTSALQNMMDKGHLSGMSKTAAVLMRNAHRSSELSSSTSDLLSAAENKSASISMENLANCDINPVKVEDDSVNRGDCDGKEDSPKDIKSNMETKSNLMQNLSSNTGGSYFTSWKEKYSVSDSIDSENDNTEGLNSYK